MRLHDRFLVEGTTPPIYIGHRQFRDRKTGKTVVGRRWHAEWNHEGKKFDESLKTTNKAAAIRVAHKIVGRIEQGGVRQIRMRTEWQEMWDEYISFLKSKGRAPKTIEKYEYVTTCFMEFVKDRKRTRPENTSPADFWKFNEKMRDDGLHLKTIEDRLVIVKQWFKWATVRAKPPLLAVNPLAAEEIEEAESSPQPCFTPQQVLTLLEKADEHDRPIYAVLAYLGLRFGEARDLMWSDFDFSQGANGWVNIQRGGSGNRTKGKASRRIPVSKELRKILDGLPRHEDGRVFHRRASSRCPEGNRPLSGEKLLKSLKRLCKRCKFHNPEQYKLHTFRHVFASMLARKKGVSLPQALAWMGHRDSKILDLYVTLFDEDAEKAMEAIDYSAESAA